MGELRFEIGVLGEVIKRLYRKGAKTQSCAEKSKLLLCILNTEHETTLNIEP
jgi:hypothetical protein